MNNVLRAQRDDIAVDASKGIEWRKEQITVTNVLEGVLRDGEVIIFYNKSK